MGRWIRALGLLSISAGSVLALTLGAAAVSADGGTMGKSGSNPDGNGADKPFVSEGQGTTAASAPASQGPAYFDGNNGCGQDRKHDLAPDHQGGYDDNNGHCGKPADSQVSGESEHGKAAAAAQQNVAGEANVGAEVAAEAQAKGEMQAAVAAEQARAAAPQQSAVAAEAAVAPAAEGPAAVPALGGNPSSGTPFATAALLLAAAVTSLGGLALLMRRPI